MIRQLKGTDRVATVTEYVGQGRVLLTGRPVCIAIAQGQCVGEVLIQATYAGADFAGLPERTGRRSSRTPPPAGHTTAWRR